MTEFLKSYGIWIIAGIFLLAMLVRSRGHAGGGCGMGGSHQHNNNVQNNGEEKKEDQHKHSGCC